jgi:cephalosporin hydroxylase
MANRAIERLALQKPTELAAFLQFADELGHSLNTVVEIGTAQGGTFGALCEIAADDALIVSIDLPGGDKDETSANDKYGARDVRKMAGYAKSDQQVKFLRADSQKPATRAELERILGDRTIDLLFIDGDHSYEGVKADFKLYQPLVASTGVIGLHDVATHVVAGVRVDMFWAELKKRFAVRECIYPGEDRGWGSWAGIGIIAMEEQ